MLEHKKENKPMPPVGFESATYSQQLHIAPAKQFINMHINTVYKGMHQLNGTGLYT